MSLTAQQIQNIQIDYGIVFANYGETDVQKLGPSRGGGEFNAENKVRDIEYDGSKGKTMGMQVIESIDASLKINILDMSIPVLALAMPYATLAGDGIATPYSLTCKSGAVDVFASTSYLKNITMFCKTIAGTYKKITLYNALNESPFGFKAAPKGEGEIEIQFDAHWDATDDAADLYKVEDVASLTIDVIKPTLIAVPADADAAVVVSSTMTATFSEDVLPGDINADNFVMIKSADGTVIEGDLTYVVATKIASFTPTVSLTAATPYIWSIARVRDNNGNMMLPIFINFTTA